ncbi:MAG: hypothetical protein Q4D16_01235 [Eubacteriales bacterium]|nr:hypothetical protein [Eubacteriales bacterium]
MGKSECRKSVERVGITKSIGEIDWKELRENYEDNLLNDTFAQGIPYYIMAPEEHCVDYVDFTPAAHAFCRCQDASGKKIPDCTPKNFLDPYATKVCFDVANPPGTKENLRLGGRKCTNAGETFYPLTAYCCCSCFAFGTKIGIPGGIRKIESFVAGDEVMAASVLKKGENPVLKWEPLRVDYSSGTGENGYQSSMIYIRHGEGGSTIATCNQLFLMADGKLKRADRLRVGQDYLVDKDGNKVEIHELSIGDYHGGVHHISIEAEKECSLDKHLLLSDGVVCGDFHLQIHADDLIEKGFMDPVNDMPKLGTKAYETVNQNVIQKGHYRVISKNAAELKQVEETRPFYVMGEKTVKIPKNAAAYFTTAQQNDIMEKTPTYDFDELGNCNTVIQYLCKLFHGFYPDNDFSYDQSRLEPNVYGFKTKGRNKIVVTGGLVRIKELKMEGLAMMISHMVVRLRCSEPLGENGYTSVGMTDYYSIGVMQTVFLGSDYNKNTTKGMDQIEKVLFANISPENRLYSTDPYIPSTEKRVEALDAGFGMDFPPEDIGGPVYMGLELVSADAVRSEKDECARVTLTFNMPLNPKKAGTVAGFWIKPDVKVKEALCLEDCPEKVILKTDIVKNTEYVVTVSRGMTAKDGSTMNTEKNTASFQLQDEI